MWEREFSEEMLFESDSIIVYIPNGELKVEFFREMIALGTEWAGGEQMSEKDAEKPYKAFRIVCKSRERGIFVLKRGDKIEYESDDYDFCIRCTYVGRPCDIECSTDKEFLAFLWRAWRGGKVMIYVDSQLIEQKHFPDHTLSVRLGGYDRRGLVIRWKYDSDEECMVLWNIVHHIRSHTPETELVLELPYIPNARMDRVKK